MEDSVWSDNPPTEPGWYWVKSIDHGIRVVAQLKRNGHWNVDGMLDEWGNTTMRAVYVFSPHRIPSAEELAAMCASDSDLSARIDACLRESLPKPKAIARDSAAFAELDAAFREAFGIEDAT